MMHATKRVAIAEKGKIEAENQKTFLYSFTHELRNLINSISGNIKLASLEQIMFLLESKELPLQC